MECGRNNWKFIIWNVVALVAIIATTRLWFNNLSKPAEMTIACAHNPAHHLHSRPDRDVLPTNIAPVHYDVTITPDMEAFTFEGRVVIT